MNTISTADARKYFAEIINQVSYGQEQVLLTRRGKEVAAIVSVEELRLLQRIENKMDIIDAQKSLEESGDNISAEDTWKQLGL
ncbi:RelB/StbD replicon stabilization protein (antitoxin to RelE/StbE) [uncultured Candidatus Thioglobus sp.]|nr:RelB/StbD replicon stabilization protein (antitoxin to RelE/StbE) [uncultured Candidatus Thioglobus sp.]